LQRVAGNPELILISGDSDFVPAAKLARCEGIDFVLDSLQNRVNDDLHEHIDALLPTDPIYNLRSSWHRIFQTDKNRNGRHIW